MCQKDNVSVEKNQYMVINLLLYNGKSRDALIRLFTD